MAATRRDKLDYQQFHCQLAYVEIIPVVDLLGGQVVHARRGDRAQYRPLVSTLCDDAEPTRVVAAILKHFPSRRLYVADLDAITGRGDHAALIRALRVQHADVEFWVDAGFVDPASTARFASVPGVVAIVGSETLPDMDSYLRLRSMWPDAVLSLDFRGAAFLGPPELLASPETWCKRIVHLDLLQVGSESGPAIESASRLRLRAPDREIYAGGGVRDVADLDRLASAGLAGALVATALHRGAIRPGPFVARRPH
jgi:phosphoribosylformimino-5-aminoimidazole carboxamide ribotide isomerase